jgi:hypothetical protein
MQTPCFIPNGIKQIPGKEATMNDDSNEKKKLALKKVTIKNLAQIKGGGLTRTYSYKTICACSPPPKKPGTILPF